MKVRNLGGTGARTCGCGSWLEHWERGSGQKASACAACGKKATVGGHVVKTDGYDRNHYIVPLCDGCNKRSDDFEIGTTPLVPANKEKTCK